MYRLGDLLCFMYVYRYASLLLSMHVCFVLFPLFDLSFVDFPSVLRYCWLGLLTCKNHLPYNLYCVGGDVKHCTIQSSALMLVSLMPISSERWLCLMTATGLVILHQQNNRNGVAHLHRLLEAPALHILILWRPLLPCGYNYKASCASQTGLSHHL